MRGGTLGVFIDLGSPALRGNTIEGARQGLFVNVGATPDLEANTICDKETNLGVAVGAERPDTSGNEICGETPAE